VLAANSADVIMAVIAASGIVLAAVLPVALLNRRTLKRAAEVVDDTAQAVDTNGGPPLGETVHGIAQTLTIVQAQTHENSRAIYEVHERIGTLGEQVSQVDDKLDRHLEEVGPAVGEPTTWVRKQMEADKEPR